MDTYKADFQEIKYQMCMFAKMYILEFGNTDFYLQVVVNLGQLSRLNSVEVLLPCVSFLFWKLQAPQARMSLLLPHCGLQHLGLVCMQNWLIPALEMWGGFRSCTRLVMS